MWKPALLSLALLSALSAAAYAQVRGRAPDGSFRDSCRNAFTVGNVLNAVCRDTRGRERSTSVRLPCNGDIANINGQLTCTRGPNWGGGRFPEGSYRQSCRNLSQRGSTLFAECRDVRGAWRRTSIDLRTCRPGSDIANRNGRLVCAGADQPIPSGSYRQSCRNISMSGWTLWADCRTMGGDWRRSSIDTRQCRGRDIANQNGRLVCAGDGNQPIPSGSYRQSCRNIDMTGWRLSADCRTVRGDWRRTFLDTRQCRGRDIANNNGQLVC